MRITVFVISVLALLLLWPSSSKASQFTVAYDAQIMASVLKWWPRTRDCHKVCDWKIWKAQLAKESSLNPAAVSPVGAQGLAQFMPPTWREVAKELGIGANVSPHHARTAIFAGAYYMRKLERFWTAPRPILDRWNLARACYNAGCGNILRAQKACGGPSGFEAIMACLHQITGRHAAETRAYNPRIHQIRAEFGR